MTLHTRQMFLLMVTVYQISANFYIPDLPTRKYVELRDINIGAIFPISAYDSVMPCGTKLRSNVILQFIEALVYAVDRINAYDGILPQAKLGFVVLDDCLKESTTISQALSFLPQKEPEKCFGPGSFGSFSRDSASASIVQIYDVVGVIGSMKSSNSMAAATLLGPAQIPQVSYASSTDELSNKVQYPYFLRVVPPDKYQVDAIVSFIEFRMWKYISVVYTEGSYGEMAFKNIHTKTSEKNICIGTSHKIAEGATDEEYDKVAANLRDFARVVVLFTGPTNAKGVLAAVRRAGDEKHYIWIGSDGWAKRISNLGDEWQTALGAFTFTFFSREVEEFTEWFKSKDPLVDENPWFQEFWETHFNCKLYNQTKPCDPQLQLSIDNEFKPVSTVTPVMDAVATFAEGLDALLAEQCPEMNGTDARDCIRGPELLTYLRKVHFPGENGLVSFDENGDLLGRYLVEQLTSVGARPEQHELGIYDTRSEELNINENLITWEYIDYYETVANDTANEAGTFAFMRKMGPGPKSVCSEPCDLGEFLIQKELPCCWECKRCRENEYVTHNGTNCTACPLFWWPDQETFTSCLLIPKTYIVWKEPLAIILISLSVIGVAVTTVVLIMYIRHIKSKVIKASSREMSFLMLGGIFLGYFTVIGLLVPATSLSCKVNYFCFCVSFTWIYSPLLARSTRIYRIFTNTKSTQRLKFISRKSQVFVAMFLILLQIGLSATVTAVYNPTSQLTMPVRTERYVELSCDFTIPGLASFLSYNLVLVMVCTVLAFKTRKVPDNFNESRFISMCVYTTLVLWLAFIPSYFTAGRQYLKTVMLSTVLILNKTVAICFLFIPKIYAAIYLETGNAIRQVTSNPTRHTHVTPISSLGTPAPNFIQVRPTA